MCKRRLLGICDKCDSPAHTTIIYIIITRNRKGCCYRTRAIDVQTCMHAFKTPSIILGRCLRLQRHERALVKLTLTAVLERLDKVIVVCDNEIGLHSVEMCVSYDIKWHGTTIHIPHINNECLVLANVVVEEEYARSRIFWRKDEQLTRIRRLESKKYI
jgi:hypothetical protein